MRCFPACFGHLRRGHLTTKKVQHQCLSPSNEQHESVKLLPESHKEEEEEILNPIKLISQFQDISNEEKAVSDHSNVKKGTNEVASSNSDNKLAENEDGKVEKEREKDKEDLSMNERECLAKEIILECVQEESCCSSLFTLSIDSRKHFFGAEMGEKEVSSLLKIKKHQDQEKENFPLSKDPNSFDKSKSVSDRQCRGKDNDTAVETSLSSWLVENEKSPQKMSVGSSPESENNYGDRQVLRVIASPADMIKNLNGVSSTTITPCCSGDDQPGVGTVGRYWRQRGAAAGEVADGEVSSVGTRVLGSVEAS